MCDPVHGAGAGASNINHTTSNLLHREDDGSGELRLSRDLYEVNPNNLVHEHPRSQDRRECEWLVGQSGTWSLLSSLG